MSFETIRIDDSPGLRVIHFTRPQAGNSLNASFIGEMAAALAECYAANGPAIVVLRGSDQVFCVGGDFSATAVNPQVDDPEPLYRLWQSLASGPFISLACVQGRANAGGVGLAAACDMVLAESGASFALSELLFGLFPACVLPFLIRRIGHQRAHYLTLSTQAISAAQALDWGLADAVEERMDGLLRKHLLRLRHLDKAAIGRYKAHMAEMSGLVAAKPAALSANRAMFADPTIRAGISRYVAEGKFPWEG